ncbi:hypothetical protein Taro_012609 [Colocasia esculenta]|uniref:Uncharacterized protein n=1 Tax=Colocasia esculenta TaxID=4460 RepID=A0A843U9I4_COLES|nr:hypothetical protein [Colocasia esculenta]
MGIEIAYVTTIRNRRSKMVDRALVPQNSIPGQKFPPGACVLVHRLPYPHVGCGYLFARGSKPPVRPQFRIGASTRTINGCIQRFPVRRPNSSLGARSGRLPRLRESLAEPTHGAAQSQRSEVVFNSTRDLLPRSWIWVPEHRRYSHPLRFILTPSAKELGITFRTGIGSAYVTTIRNRHSETINRNSIPGPKFPPGACVLVHRLPYPPIGCGYLFARGSKPPARPQFRIDTSTQSVNGRIRRFPVRRPNSSLGARSDSLDYANRSRSPHAEPPSHSDRKSCSTRREISSLAKELGITFRTGIGIAYVTTIRNRHSETVDRALVL